MDAVPSSGEFRLTLPCTCMVFCEHQEAGTACHVRASGGLQDLEKGGGTQRREDSVRGSWCAQARRSHPREE